MRPGYAEREEVQYLVVRERRRRSASALQLPSCIASAVGVQYSAALLNLARLLVQDGALARFGHGLSLFRRRLKFQTRSCSSDAGIQPLLT